MGRRARTNCSPVDSVLEKYHNDIGNRLSGLFMPPPNTDNSQGLSDDFCMLTLDLRRANSLKHHSKGEKTVTSTINSSLIAQVDNNELRDSSSTKAESMLNAASAFQPLTDGQVDLDIVSKDKTRLVDKLTRALFQKKHVCARCKRKSRSCLLNKTFSAMEKRYTCGRCRENASALKNLFDTQMGPADGSHSKDSPLSSALSSSSKREGTMLPQSRTCNDSGYETVTSCSTVASSYSAFNTPNSKNISSKDNSNSREISDSGDTHSQICNDLASHHNQQGVPCQQQVPLRLPTPHQYDGYLPDFIEFRDWKRQTQRPCSHGDVVDQEEDGECAEGGIMCVRRPTSLNSSPRPIRKACHICGTTSVPCFRLPWEGGWLCEDCMDGIY